MDQCITGRPLVRAAASPKEKQLIMFQLILCKLVIVECTPALSVTMDIVGVVMLLSMLKVSK